jgi:hypothetical protein
VSPAFALSRRAVLSAGAVALCGVAGCADRSRPTGTLAVRARNFGEQPRELEVAVFVDGAEEPTGRWTTSLSGKEDGSVQPPERIWRIEDVRDQAPYRLVATVDGQRYEREDLANCIADRGDVRGIEYADITIQDDGPDGQDVTLLSDDCPAE